MCMTHLESVRFGQVRAAAVPARERDAFSDHVRDGDGWPRARIEAWCGDFLEGEVR